MIKRILLAVAFLSCSAKQTSSSRVQLIIGSDDRIEVLATGYPFSTIGRLTIGASGKECTATLIWRNLIITAAHCVTESNGSIIFSPNFVDNEVRQRNDLPLRSGENTFSKAELVVSGTYNSSQNVDQDWAILRLQQALGDTYNWLDMTTDSLMEGNVSLVGYSLDFFRYVQARGVAAADGNCLISKDQQGVLSHDCDSAEGASGAPLLRMKADGSDVSLAAIHSSADLTETPPSNLAVSANLFKQQVAKTIADQVNAIGNRPPPERILVHIEGSPLISPPPFAEPNRIASANHNCVVSQRGKVRCWGSAHEGALGYGNTNIVGDNETPAQVGDVKVGDTVQGIAIGGYRSCALTLAGTLRCWGENEYGELGYGHTGTIGDDELPSSIRAVDFGTEVVQLSSGYRHVCALFRTGKVRCWGRGIFGQLGYGNESDVLNPLPVGDVDVGGTVKQIAAGHWHTCALLASAKVRCWGDSSYGALGYPGRRKIGTKETPAQVGDIDLGGPAKAIAAGFDQTCAILFNGSLVCWGKNDYGQLGYGHRKLIGDDETPATVGPINVGGQVKQVSIGDLHTCAVLVTGSARCWGRGDEGLLGYGNMRSIGANEAPASAGDIDVGAKVLQIAAGVNQTCALLEGDKVRCWGSGGALYAGLGFGNRRSTIGDDETPRSAGDVPVGF